MNIGFRVDANEAIATGHLMRCIAIAAECRRRGQQCLFLMAEDKETSRLKDRQFSFEVLHTRWNALEEELPVLCEVVKREHIDWLVVDTYQATPEYLRQLNQIVPVLYIDDMALETYSVSVLLHYGLCPDLKEYKKRYVDTKTKLLAGLKYIPLREEFSPKEECLPQKGCVEGEKESLDQRERSILITTGGTDPYNITGKLLVLCLLHPSFSGYQYHVIVGSMNNHENELRKMELEHTNIHLHKNVTNMEMYMRQCQLAVSAGGTTLFELCACGIPTICFSFADNQQAGTAGMGKRKIMQYAGDARDTNVAETIRDQLLSLIQSRTLRQEYTNRMRELVDGKGVQRIADVLSERRKDSLEEMSE